MRVFIGLDPGTEFGFSFVGLEGSEIKLLAFGTWSLDEADGKARKGTEAAALGKRMSSLWNLLDGSLNEIEKRRCYPVAGVCYESLSGGWAFKSSRAAILHGAQAGVISLWANSRKRHLFGVTPGEIKAAATGKGNAKKEQVLAHAIEMFGTALWIPRKLSETHEAEATLSAYIIARRFLEDGI